MDIFPPSERIMGIDTSLRSTGLAVIAQNGGKCSLLDFEVIKNSTQIPISGCLLKLHKTIEEWINNFSPNVVALEEVFYCKNFKTAFVLGEARGAVIATCATFNLPIFEYSPRKVKQAVVGSGSADKSQIVKMIKNLFQINEDVPEDAADAIAIALCHANSIRLNQLLNKAKPI